MVVISTGERQITAVRALGIRGGEQYLPAALVGKTSRDFDASETITQFFLGL